VNAFSTALPIGGCLYLCFLHVSGTSFPFGPEALIQRNVFNLPGYVLFLGQSKVFTLFSSCFLSQSRWHHLAIELFPTGFGSFFRAAHPPRCEVLPYRERRPCFGCSREFSAAILQGIPFSFSCQRFFFPSSSPAKVSLLWLATGPHHLCLNDG